MEQKNKTFNIYCDESTHLPNDRCPYMIYGYVSVASNQIKMIREQLKQNMPLMANGNGLEYTTRHIRCIENL